MSMVNVRRDVEINLEFFGAKDGPVVALVAGAGAPARFWPDDFCEALAAAGYRVLRYDHRDTGLSTHFDHPYPLQELRADLEAVLREAGGGPVHLVGHSMGGYLVQVVACRGDLPVASVTSISAGSVTDPAQFARLDMTGPSEETWSVLMKNQPTGDMKKDLPGWLGSWRFMSGQTAFEEERAVDYMFFATATWKLIEQNLLDHFNT